MKCTWPWFLILLTALTGSETAAQQAAGGGGQADSGPRIARLHLVGASAAAASGGRIAYEPTSRYVQGAGAMNYGSVREIYPGIDAVMYGNEHCFEYAFVLQPGASSTAIAFAFDELRPLTLTPRGEVIYEGVGMDGYQMEPYAYRVKPTGSESVPVHYQLTGQGVSIVIDDLARAQRERLNNTDLQLIGKNGQPGGPDYDFLVSRYEVNNEQFLQFLNNAEASTNSPLGAHMFFDPAGNVWINPARQQQRDELFNVARSQLVYDPGKQPGARYEHRRDQRGETPFTRHPVTGASWFGALKYCNWLTLHTGRGLAELCYREGTNALDWAPVTATNWQGGVFGNVERDQWLRCKGFRLPMVNTDPFAMVTNRFNEFYKAAAWNATSNSLYGFGRNRSGGADANTIDTVNRHSMRTFPVGFFNGDNLLDDVETGRSDNYYDLYDMSGNVAEWTSDFGWPNSAATRAVCGGSWNERLKPVTVGELADPHATSDAGGFRVVTTYTDAETLVVHTLFCFHIPSGIADNVREPKAGDTAAEAAKRPDVPDERPTYNVLGPRQFPGDEGPPGAIRPDVGGPGGGGVVPGVIGGGETSPGGV